MGNDLIFRKVEPGDIEFVAENMRQADADEVMAANNDTPLSALLLSVEKSHESVTVTDTEGTPLVIFGIRHKTLLTDDSAIIWMLGCDEALKHSKSFMVYTPKVLEIWLKQYKMLENYVHVGNKVSVAWLKRLGFTLEDPVIFPNTGECFMHFFMEG